MLSLGIKECVINDFADWKVTTLDAAGAVEADPSVATQLVIEGFGTFQSANIVDSTVARKVDAVKEISTVFFTDDGLTGGTKITPVANVIYVVQFFVRTTRYQSEYANDFIKQGRPIVVEVVGDGTSSLAELVIVALNARNSRFAIGEATPFTFVVLGTDKGLTNTVTHQSLHIEKVLYRAKADLLDTSSPIIVTTEGTEGQGNGSQVEESVRMGFGENVNPYGIKAGTNVSVGGAYSELFWKVNVGITEKVGYVLDASPLSRQVSFNVFANESGNDGSGGAIEVITEFLLASRAAGVITASVPVPGAYLADGTVLVNGVTATAAAAAALFIA
jgi:hypothetical protein